MTISTAQPPAHPQGTTDRSRGVPVTLHPRPPSHTDSRLTGVPVSGPVPFKLSPGSWVSVPQEEAPTSRLLRVSGRLRHSPQAGLAL